MLDTLVLHLKQKSLRVYFLKTIFLTIYLLSHCLFVFLLHSPEQATHVVFATPALNFEIDPILTDEEFLIHRRIGEGKVNCLTSIPAY